MHVYVSPVPNQQQGVVAPRPRRGSPGWPGAGGGSAAPAGPGRHLPPLPPPTRDTRQGRTFCSRTRSLESGWLEINRWFSTANTRALGPRVLITAYLLLPGSFRLAHQEGGCVSSRAPAMPFVHLRGAVLCGGGFAWEVALSLPPQQQAGLRDGAGTYRGPVNNCHAPNNLFKVPAG